MKLRIGVIFGGRSGEHEISCRSARTVIEQADPDKYEIVPLAITNDGNWLSPAESLGLLPESVRTMFGHSDSRPEAEGSGEPAAEGSGSRQTNEITSGVLAGGHLATLDVVFPVLHGTFGEDGTIQGLLEMANIPYVGCGVLASSTGMDKAFMKTLFRDAGLPICD